MKLNLSKILAILEQVLNLAHWLLGNMQTEKDSSKDKQAELQTA